MPSQGFQQVQKQTQSLILAPQLRQSLKILQVPALELRNTILEELETNPTLEEMPYDSMSIEAQINGTNGVHDEPERHETAAGDTDEVNLNKEDFEVFRKMQEDYRDYLADENASYSYTSDDAEKRQHFFDSLTTESSLQEDLMRQAEMTDASPEALKAVEFILGSLDDNGFVTSTLADIALMAELPLKTVQDAQKLLKHLDPPGIGSLNVQDCLLTQLEQQGKRATPAYVIVRDHYNLLLRRRIPDIARRVSMSADDVHEAIEQIAKLDPAPGRRFSDDNNRIVVPDVKVEKDEYGEWQITLNNDYIPRLRISSIYKDLIARGTLAKKEKEYIQDKFRSSKFLISSIEQRQQTIERITRELLRFQRDFFEEGPSKLRPLTMNQVAETVGVHETTVSRALANKYIDTPHGVYDFKYFFTTGYQGVNGHAVSNTSVKERIQKLIEAENPAKPYSDQQVVEILQEEDIKIARRTVAKYREELGILPTNLRRHYG